MPFCKISIPGNYVKLRYFSQFISCVFVNIARQFPPGCSAIFEHVFSYLPLIWWLNQTFLLFLGITTILIYVMNMLKTNAFTSYYFCYVIIEFLHYELNLSFIVSVSWLKSTRNPIIFWPALSCRSRRC